MSRRLRTALEESLGLFLVGGACLALAAYYLASGTRWGDTRLPIWELFMALGIIGVTGGLISMAAEDEGAPRSVGRPYPRVVAEVDDGSDVPGPIGPSPVAEAALDDEPEETAPADDDAPDEPTEPPSDAGPSEDPEPRSSTGALAELADLEYDLKRRPRPAAVQRARAAEVPARSTSRAAIAAVPVASDPVVPAPTAPGAECGGCGRSDLGPSPDRCPECGSLLCRTCWDGLEPPPCPGCVAFRPIS